ncbi:MAG: hypothetical protein NZ954_00995 [Thermofilaceae archaeon]|nr:hypothetical protein [Thermofilaceae archaeon]MCX8180241.1 hypothetical protein [Thermofilaceae archaeon]MDW8004039.1 hypothetical protein [Thermofilaceae archaeon]
MARILPEFAAYLPGERVKLVVETEKGGELLLKSSFEPLRRLSVSPGVSVIEIDAGDPGVYEIVLEPEGVAASLAVLERPSTPPLVAIVFHNHQAPNYSPNGSIREPWAFKHTWENEFHPYFEGGAYYVQAKLLKKWDIAWNANLSPSLLQQWVDLVKRGVVINSDSVYLCIGPESPAANRVAETLQTFIELSRGRLEVLTSFYSHPLSGYIVESFGWIDLLREELKLGKAITSQVIGVDPRGVWLPEMSFSMKLIPILLDLGIEYTILDSVSHFTGAVGDKGGIFEPYTLDGLTVFFRHTGLSDLWSFKYSNVKSLKEAEVAARELTLRIVLEAYLNRAKPLTLALDGENWMVLPSPKPTTPVLFDELLHQLKIAERKGLIKMVKLSEIVKEGGSRRLLSVPSKSWMGGYDKWTSERAVVQEKIWANVVNAYETFKALVNSVGCREEDLLALMHVVNSDHIWAEFADESFSHEWASTLENRLNLVLASIKLEGFSNGKLKLCNKFDRPVRVYLREDGTVREVTLPTGFSEIEVAGSLVEIELKGWRKSFKLCKPLVKK